MADAQASAHDEPELPPPGRRWGAGAQSVLPYLTKSLQAKPAPAAEGREPRGHDDRPLGGCEPHPRA